MERGRYRAPTKAARGEWHRMPKKAMQKTKGRRRSPSRAWRGDIDENMDGEAGRACELKADTDRAVAQ